MEKLQNKFLSVSYQLYSIDDDGQKQLEEQTQHGRPFQFISGYGFSLDAFEQKIAALQQGEQFDFTLTPAEAFGEYFDEGVHTLKRDMFMVDGRFDEKNIYPGAVITLMDSDEKRFMARVTEVKADSVVVDTNHPLAGLSLQFVGQVLENREATPEELQQMLHHMSCGCGGDCNCDDCGDGGCGGGCGGCH